MIYNVGRDFIKVQEFSGTVSNNSFDCTVEISTKPVPGTGKLIAPNESLSFRYKKMYMRCVDGEAEVDCVPYDLDPEKHVDGDTFVEGDDYLHLTFDFPTGSNKTMLLRNPRPDLTIADLQNFSEYTIEQDIFRNDFGEPTLGLKKIMMIKSMVRGKGGGSSSSDLPTIPSGEYVPYEDWEHEIIAPDKPIITPVVVPTITYDTRRKLSRDEELISDLRRILSTDQTIFDVDLRRRVKWRWLTRILPDSSFLDPKMYAAADALDDQITLFHWAIRNVLHLPRLGELKGTILDLLADQFHVDAYDAINFTDDEKRELIRSSIEWHRIKGTPAAVEKVLAVAFKYSKIAEWFEYGGNPYYFRLYIKGTAYSPGSFQSFWRMFLDAKNVRSHLEKVIIDLSPEDPIRIYTGIAKVRAGNRKIPLPHLPPDFTQRQIFTGIFKYIAGNIIKQVIVPKLPDKTQRQIYTGVIAIRRGNVKTRVIIPRAPDTARKIYSGVVTIRRGSRTIGMYQST